MQAILITAYKNLDHLKSIISFFDNQFSIYIHIDKKSQIPKTAIEELKKYENVYYISQTYTVNWGGLNHLKAILELSREALKEEENTFFHLITGHDYPIKSIDYFKSWEKENFDKIFMEYHPLPYNAWSNGGIDRLAYYNLYDWVDGRNGLGEMFVKQFIKLQKWLGVERKLGKDFPKLYGGSTYWSINRKALAYVFHYLESKPEFLKRFKYSFCSEEIFFQTILLNSDFKEKIINDPKRFIIWEKRNGNYPANLDLGDLDQIQNSHGLFARKFEYPVSLKLLSELKRLKS